MHFLGQIRHRNRGYPGQRDALQCAPDEQD
ncbi:Uncharacterised protein [Mycobacterium tuberculosis]|nr:Uncharacterised protein [Mycobacterium tuberculosis]